VKDVLDLVDDGAGRDGHGGRHPVPAAARARAARGARHGPVDAAVSSCAPPAPTSPGRRPGGATVGLVALEDLVEAFVGTVRDATHRQGLTGPLWAVSPPVVRFCRRSRRLIDFSIRVNESTT
jgi:hypothetical protein